MVVGEVSGQNGCKKINTGYCFYVMLLICLYIVYGMVKYAQDYVTCRKILFERYFSLEQRKEGLVNKITPDQPCGICDNCNRPESEIQIENIYPVAKSIIQLCDMLRTVNERVTMAKLVQMVQGRGLGLIKSRVISSPDIGIPIDRKYSDYVSW